VATLKAELAGEKDQSSGFKKTVEKLKKEMQEKESQMNSEAAEARKQAEEVARRAKVDYESRLAEMKEKVDSLTAQQSGEAPKTLTSSTSSSSTLALKGQDSVADVQLGLTPTLSDSAPTLSPSQSNHRQNSSELIAIADDEPTPMSANLSLSLSPSTPARSAGEKSSGSQSTPNSLSALDGVLVCL
tara:strand:+ start:326 stop:886 length:561 start_codon:yes stop_codon:yes gene_type:complete